MYHVLRLPPLTAATAKRLQSNILFPSFRLGNNITYTVTLLASLTESRLRIETIVDHRELVEAISDRDSQRAEKAMVQHIEYNRILLQEVVSKLKQDNEKNANTESKNIYGNGGATSNAPVVYNRHLLVGG